MARKPRKVLTFRGLQKKIKALEASLSDSRRHAATLQVELNAARSEAEGTATRAARQKEGARVSIDRLKGQVLDLTIENARLQGYIGRVQEDDVVRDGVMERTDSEGKKIIVDRRQPVMRVSHADNGCVASNMGHYSERPQPWITL